MKLLTSLRHGTVTDAAAVVVVVAAIWLMYVRIGPCYESTLVERDVSPESFDCFIDQTFFFFSDYTDKLKFRTLIILRKLGGNIGCHLCLKRANFSTSGSN